MKYRHRKYADDMLEARSSLQSSLTEREHGREPIVHYRPRSKSAAEFHALTQEVLGPWPLTRKQIRS